MWWPLRGLPFLIETYKFLIESYKIFIETYKVLWPWAQKKMHVETITMETKHRNN